MLFRRFLFLVICSLTISLAFANDNPRLLSWPPGKILGFRGLDTRSSTPTIEDSRATDLLNVKLSQGLNLKKRYGYSVINSTLDDPDTNSPAITGIFDAEYSTTSFTLAFLGNRIKYDNSGVWTRVPSSATLTDDQDNQTICVMALDNSICINNSDKPIAITSTPTASHLSFSGLSNPITKAKAVIWFRNYLIFGNTTENSTSRPTRFRWSNVGTINTYSDNDFVDIASLSGDEIIAFKELYGDLYIFMRKSIWKASLVGGNDVFVFTKVIDGLGAISKLSVQTIVLPDDRLAVNFLSEDKRILMFNGIVVTDVGYRIQPTLDNLNEARLQYAVGLFDQFSYYLSVSDGGSSTNDIVYDLNIATMEWTKHDQIDANAMARVKESTSLIKTYFSNYEAFIYWLDNPDNINDVDGATGIVDSVGYLTSGPYTYQQAIIDTGLTAGAWTGAIIRITSGTGQGQESVILSGLTTGVVVATAFSTTPDSTSNYSIGDINSYYKTKWYDFGDAPRYKAFRGMFFWAKEQSNSSVDTAYAEDFGSDIGSETKSLSPSSSSLWDSAIWDSSVWGTTGDKLYNVQHTGHGRNIRITFSQDDIDKTFELYGFHLLADRLDIE